MSRNDICSLISPDVECLHSTCCCAWLKSLIQLFVVCDIVCAHSICLVLLYHCVSYLPTPRCLVHLVFFAFRNHRNRKVAGGTNNVIVHYVYISAPGPFGVVLCTPFKWDILWFIISDRKSCFLCASHKSEMNFVPQPQEQKSFKRHKQCSSTLCGC